MSDDLRRLGTETLVYGLSTVVARLLNFLLLPFYTHFLVPGEYGAVTTAYSYIAFLNILFLLGLDQSYLRFGAGVEDARADSAYSTATWTLVAWGAAGAALLALGARPLARWGGLAFDGPLVVRLAAATLLLDALATPAFAELRLSHRSWLFVGVKTFNIALSVVLNVVFLAHFHLGVRGVFMAGVIASGATLALLAPVHALRMRPRFERPLWGAMLRFGLPFVPAGLGAMIVQVADRPIMLKLTDSATVGVYSANYRLGIFMMLVVSMFDQAFRPFYLERAEKPGTPELLARVFTVFVAASAWLALAMAFFVPDLVRVKVAGTPLIAPDYWRGLGVVPVVLFAYVLNGCYLNFLAPVVIAKRTERVAFVTALGAFVNVAANLVLIPRAGMMGAAWATFLAYGAMAAQMHWSGRRAWPVPYEWGRVLAALAPVAAAGAAGWLLWGRLGGAPWALARLGLLGAVLAAWVPCGVFSHLKADA